LLDNPESLSWSRVGRRLGNFATEASVRDEVSTLAVMGGPVRRRKETGGAPARPKILVSSDNPPLTSSFSFFAADPSKAYFERFSLVWAPLSLLGLLGGVFGTGLYKQCGRDEYLVISIIACLPGVVWPLLFPAATDAGKPYAQRFWVKAAVWISIFSFYGNYFWTHYFYTVLGASYLFDSYMFNNVPIVCYLCTFFYFTFYFSLINVVLRSLVHVTKPLSTSRFRIVRIVASAALAAAVFTLAVLTAVFEAVSVQHFPLYTYSDRASFLTVGSVFYGMYFMVGFPMFFALDESIPVGQDQASNISLSRATPVVRKSVVTVTVWYVTQNALAAVALVTLFLDLWRLALGGVSSAQGLGDPSLRLPSVPFIYQLQTLAATPSGGTVKGGYSVAVAGFATSVKEWLKGYAVI
jgi:cycloeucalenol cycloisomerase